MGHSSRTLVELLCVGDLSQEQPTALQNSLDQTASPGWKGLTLEQILGESGEQSQLSVYVGKIL